MIHDRLRAIEGEIDHAGGAHNQRVSRIGVIHERAPRFDEDRVGAAGGIGHGDQVRVGVAGQGDDGEAADIAIVVRNHGAGASDSRSRSRIWIISSLTQHDDRASGGVEELRLKARHAHRHRKLVGPHGAAFKRTRMRQVRPTHRPEVEGLEHTATLEDKAARPGADPVREPDVALADGHQIIGAGRERGGGAVGQSQELLRVGLLHRLADGTHAPAQHAGHVVRQFNERRLTRERAQLRLPAFHTGRHHDAEVRSLAGRDVEVGNTAPGERHIHDRDAESIADAAGPQGVAHRLREKRIVYADVIRARLERLPHAHREDAAILAHPAVWRKRPLREILAGNPIGTKRPEQILARVPAGGSNVQGQELVVDDQLRRAARHIGQAHVPTQRPIRHVDTEVFIGVGLAHHGCDAAIERQRRGHQLAHPQRVGRIRVGTRCPAGHQHHRLTLIRSRRGDDARGGLQGVTLTSFVAVGFRSYRSGKVARAGRARIGQIEITSRHHDWIAGTVLKRQLKPKRDGIRVVGEMKGRHFAAFKFTGVNQVLVVEQAQVNLRQLPLALDDEMRRARAAARGEPRIHLAFTGHEQIVVARNHRG